MNESACDLIEIRLDRAKAYKIEDLIQLVAHAEKNAFLHFVVNRMVEKPIWIMRFMKKDH